MRNVDVIICYEHKNREFESAARIAAILRLKGYSCIIKQLGWDEPFAKIKYSPKVVVTPWCYDGEDYNQFSRYCGGMPNHTFSVVNLHCEQIAFNDAIDFCLPKGRAKNVFHCCWGEYFEDLLLKSNIDRSLVSCTGSPRLDFFDRKYAKSKVELATKYGLDASKKWVILVGNFSQMYFDSKRIKELSRRGIENVSESKELSKESFFGICKWMEKLFNECDEASSLEFIYRPHPSEQINSVLSEFEKHYHCFHVISDLPIREWYLNTDLAFVWSSTSSVEAAYANTPVISLRPVEIPENKRFDLIEKLGQIHSYSSFKETIYSCVMGKKIETNKEFLESVEHYYGDRSVDACLKTADLIDEIIRNKSYVCTTSKFYWFMNLLSALRCAMKRLAILIGAGKGNKSWERIVSDHVDSATMEEAVKKFALIEKEKYES